MWVSIQLLLTFLAAFFTLAHSIPTRNAATVKGLGVQIANIDATNVIPNKYIVVYNSTFSDDAIDTYQASVVSAVKKRNLQARHVSGRTLSTTVKTVSMGSWRCMALEADDNMIMDIANSDEVGFCKC
jgi:hypothetical protein